MKKFWTYIKHKKKDNVGISSLKMDGRLFTDPTAKSDILNQQFKSAFSKKSKFTRRQFINSKRMDPSVTHPRMQPINITLNGITKLLKNLNPYKAQGPDNISPRILKELADDIAPLLLLIYKKSLETGEVPPDWRSANVSPVYKNKGLKSSPENYRPISLTSVCCKILEHIITSSIMQHAEAKNILYPLQHGFRKNRSCETQLIEFVDDISKNLQDGHQTDILIMDFAKAFDKVNHSLLIHKLNYYGIDDQTTSWIQNWLEDRQQTVVLDGASSEAVSVDSGVPQGSVLGPALFLFYINDLQSRLTSKVRLFADDTIVYLTITNGNDSNILQEDLNKLGQWEKEWCMQFHPDKCNVLTVTNKTRQFNSSYQLHGHTLEAVTSAKYLGLTFTNKLQWDQHISNITNKASKTLGFLRRNLKIPSIRIKEQAYQTLVRPLVEYASTVWDPYTKTDIDKIEAVQRRAARYVISNFHNRSSVSNMLLRLKWKPLAKRRKDARLMMMYKIDRELVAIRKENRLIPPNRFSRNAHSRSFQLQACRIDSRKMSFFPRTVRDWNALPPDIVELDTPEAFKARIVSLV